MKTHTNPSQENKILRHLKAGKKLTPMQALVAFGCFRLAARVHQLRKKGHKIKVTTTTDKKSGKKFATYSI